MGWVPLYAMYTCMPCVFVSSVPRSMTQPWEQLLSEVVGRLDELLPCLVISPV